MSERYSRRESAIHLASDGPTYAISELDIRYLRENPLHPSIDDAMLVPITLGTPDTGYVAPRPCVPEVSITLADIADREILEGAIRADTIG